MKLTQLEKANRILEEIKQLDTEIIRLDKLADTFSNKSFKIKLTLRVKDLEKEGSEKENMYEAMRKAQAEFYRRIMYGEHNPIVAIEYGNKDVLHKENIDEVIGLEIIAVLLSGKQKRRKSLIVQLKKFGIEI